MDLLDPLDPPQRPLPIRPEKLTECLRESGHLDRGSVTAVENPASFDTVFAHFHRLKVTYSNDSRGGAPAALMLKQSRAELWGTFEAVFYREIAKKTIDPAVPRCYGAALATGGESSYLLLQDITDTHHWAFRAFQQSPTEAESRAILAELLKFHVQWWEHPRLNETDFMQLRPGNLRMSQAATAELVRRNCREFAEVEIPRFADRYRDAFRNEWRDICERSVASWEELFVPRIEKGRALTLIHGDPHKANLFLPRHPDQDRLVWLDWQTYVRGIAPYDVAYWLFATQTSECRRAIEMPILRWYHEQLLGHGITGYTWEDCHHDYRLAVIMNVFAPLMWQNPTLLERAIQAFQDQHCAELLG